MIAMPSVLISIMNAILITVSETAVNFYGIYYKLQTLIYVPASGLVQGMRPIVGYNQGAKKYSRMNATVWWSVLVVGSIIFIGSLVFLFFPAQILALFKANDEMLKIGVPALRIIASGFLISTLGVILSGRSRRSEWASALCSLRSCGSLSSYRRLLICLYPRSG